MNLNKTLSLATPSLFLTRKYKMVRMFSLISSCSSSSLPLTPWPIRIGKRYLRDPSFTIYSHIPHRNYWENSLSRELAMIFRAVTANSVLLQM